MPRRARLPDGRRDRTRTGVDRPMTPMADYPRIPAGPADPTTWTSAVAGRRVDVERILICPACPLHAAFSGHVGALAQFDGLRI